MSRRERLEILERELVQQPGLLNVAPAVGLGETLMVSYFEEIGPSIDGDAVLTAPDVWFKTEEFSYREVRFALARPPHAAGEDQVTTVQRLLYNLVKNNRNWVFDALRGHTGGKFVFWVGTRRHVASHEDIRYVLARLVLEGVRVDSAA